MGGKIVVVLVTSIVGFVDTGSAGSSDPEIPADTTYFSSKVSPCIKPLENGAMRSDSREEAHALPAEVDVIAPLEYTGNAKFIPGGLDPWKTDFKVDEKDGVEFKIPGVGPGTGRPPSALSTGIWEGYLKPGSMIDLDCLVGALQG